MDPELCGDCGQRPCFLTLPPTSHRGHSRVAWPRSAQLWRFQPLTCSLAALRQRQFTSLGKRERAVPKYQCTKERKLGREKKCGRQKEQRISATS